jgi:hypothetical protein
MITGAPVNVKDFGAAGDGSTDDYAAIQAAVDSISSSGTIFFPAGNYTISAHISIVNKAILIEGNNATITTTATSDYTILYVDSSNCTIQNLTFQKPSALSCAAIDIKGDNHTLRNLNGGNNQIWSSFIYAEGVRQSQFSEIYCTNDTTNLTGSIFKFDYGVNNTISNCFIGFCQYGVYFTSVAHPTSSYHSEGFDISGLNCVYAQTAINGNYITQLSLVNSILDFCKYGGVWVTNGVSAIVSGNWIASDASSDASYIGVNCHVNYSGFLVSGNTFLANSAFGQAINAASAYTRIIGNLFVDIPGGGGGSGSTTVIGNTYSGVSATQFTIAGGVYIDPYQIRLKSFGAGNSGFQSYSPSAFTGNGFMSVSSTASGIGWNHFLGQSSDGGTTNVLILGNGNLQNANNSYGAISDIKAKENIVDTAPKLADLLKVKVRNYNLKSDPDLKQIGVVAQELETVFPGLIEETQDVSYDEHGKKTILNTTTKSVKYSVFVPILIKAIQELSARVEALESK